MCKDTRSRKIKVDASAPHHPPLSTKFYSYYKKQNYIQNKKNCLKPRLQLRLQHLILLFLEK